MQIQEGAATRRALASSLSLVLVLASAWTVAAAPLAAGAPIEPAVLAQLDTKAETTAWIILKAKADLSPAYRMSDWDARGTFVVQRLTSVADTSQTGLRRMLAARGVAFEPFWILNAIKVRAGKALLDAVAARPEVARIIGDVVFRIPTPQPAAGEPSINSVEWGIDRIGAPEVWSEFSVRGEGIVVGTIDTGALYTHPAIVNQYRGNLGGGSFDHDYDWYDPSNACGNPSLTPCDNNGHGTHVLGTIAGDDGGGNQIGVAPGARWIAAKGCESGSCSTSALLNSGQWMLAPRNLNGQSPRADLRPHLVSNSWGSNSGGDTFYQATVQSWVASGIFPVFANGNAGPSCGTVGAPGSYPEAYGVGAFDSGNTIASFSSRGPAPATVGGQVKPDISAPGVSIRSSWNNGGYNTISGTSMATPHVSGAIALLWSAAPALVGDIATTRSLLDQTAIDVSNTTCGGTAGDNNVWGEGRLDAYAAVATSPRGPTGTLTGIVTVAGTSTPIAGATVSATGPSSRSTTTNGSGVYSLTLSVGTYSVSGSRFGYAASTVNGASVTQGTTTTQDLALTSLPTRSVSGTVRDADGAAVAGATVTILGTPITPATTNGGGAYSFPAVPEGDYSARAEPSGRCLTGVTRALTVGAANVAGFDFTLATKEDAFGYRCRVESTAFVNGSSALALSGDDAVAAVALPFPFTFYGTSYSTAFVTTNGFLSFAGSSTAWSNTTIPTTTTPNAAIYPYWDDLFVDASAGIYTATLGSAPNRQFVIEWRNVRYFGDSGRRVGFEVILNESGDVQTMYRDIASGDGLEMGNSATVGIENAAGTVALQHSANEAVLSTGLAVRYYRGAGDTTPPSTPGSFTATSNANGTTALLTWTASTDNVGVAGYRLWRDGAFVATLLASATSYNDGGRTPGATYGYELRAFDATGNQSAPASTSVTMTAGDTTPPTAPGNLRVTSLTKSKVTLAWNASTDAVGVAGYRIYRNGSLLATVTALSHTFSRGGTAATYYVVAFDAAGNVSAASNSVTVPKK